MAGGLPATSGIGNGRRWSELKRGKKTQGLSISVAPKMNSGPEASLRLETETLQKVRGVEEAGQILLMLKNEALVLLGKCHLPQGTHGLQKDSFRASLRTGEETEIQLKPELALVTYY